MLSEKKALENQKKFGLNELQEGKKTSTIGIFFQQFKDFLVIILLCAAAASGFLGDYESTAVILGVLIMNAVLGTFQTKKASQSLDALKQMSAPMAKVKREGVLRVIPSREVTMEDEVIIEAGDYIPADGTILECASLKVDESMLTGESISVEKSITGPLSQAPIGEQTNHVFSGSYVTYGRAVYTVTGIGMETEIGKIASLLKNTSEKKTPLQKNLDDFGRKLAIVIVSFCILLFAVSVLRGNGIIDAFLFAVALAVAAIPEALSSIVTIVLSFGTQKMAKEHAIVRRLQAVEGLGSVSVICSDKTGTLTQNKMTVEEYYVDPEDKKRLLLYSILCNDAVKTKDTVSGDPTETALIDAAMEAYPDVEAVRNQYERLGELPFDSDRKLMTTLHEFEEGPVLVVKGAVDVMLDRLSEIKRGSKSRPITKEDRTNIEEKNEEFSRKGLRVLAFAYKAFAYNKQGNLRKPEFHDENNLTFIGLIGMMDPPREESKRAVMDCKEAGIKPVMITGDHKITAMAIAKRIGILEKEEEACEGEVLDSMSDEELKSFVQNISVYARVSPEHKIRIVRAWQEQENIVAMTGDGVNDAPALKQADIGVAMGVTGTEVAKDAAAMVLTDDNFATIIKAVTNGRNIYRNIKHSIQFLLSGNLAGILTVLYASLAGLVVPFAPVHLLFINLLTDSLPAIALGLEPHSNDVINDKPRPRNESILTKAFLTSVGIEGLCIAVTTILSFLLGLRSGDAVVAQTMAFATLCMARLIHGFNCKSEYPVVGKRFFSNKYLLTAFVIGLIMISAVILIPPLDGIFSVTALSKEQLLIVYGLAAVNFPVIQSLKWLRTHHR